MTTTESTTTESQPMVVTSIFEDVKPPIFEDVKPSIFELLKP